MKYYLIFILVLLVFGCAGMPASQEVAAEMIGTVDQASSVINNQMPPWMFVMVIFLAGWAIPAPGKMFGWLFSGLKTMFSFIRWW